VTEPSAFEVEMAMGKLKRHKSLGIDQIPAEVINIGARTIFSEIHKPMNSVWNKVELPKDWKEWIIVPVCKKGDATDCSNFRGTLLSTKYKILSAIQLSKLTPYAEEISGDHQCGFHCRDHQCGFHCNRSTTDHIFCICQILKKIGNTVKQCISSL